MDKDPIQEDQDFQRKAQIAILSIVFAGVAAEGAFWLNHYASQKTEQNEPTQKTLIAPASLGASDFTP